MPLLDGTPVLMCLSCHRIDTATTWESRSAAGLDRGSPEGQACHADVLLAIANGAESWVKECEHCSGGGFEPMTGSGGSHA